VRRSGLSQTTVEHTLALLQDEGLVRSVPQSGSFVSESRPPAPEPRWNLQTNAIHPELFDMKLWKRCLRETLEDSDGLASYGDSRGEQRLRLALSEYLYRLRRLRTNPDSILVGPSYQTLLFILTTLVGPRQTVAMEHHAPVLARQAFEQAGWTIMELESDEYGPLP